MEDQKYALITGATSGIGLELAKVFAENKYNLIIVARSTEELDNTSKEIAGKFGVKVETIAKDLFQKDAPFEVYDEVKSKGIKVDVLVNNAAQGQFGKFIENDINRELDIIQLNIGAYLILTKCFLKDMMQKKEGKILNVTSIAGKLPGPYQAVYHGTKAFIHSFSESIRAELKDTAITITSLLPGPTDTDFFHKADMENSKILDQGLADPEKVARDGFKALMNGDDMIISGFKNKAEVMAGNIIPDEKVAQIMMKQQGPKDK